MRRCLLLLAWLGWHASVFATAPGNGTPANPAAQAVATVQPAAVDSPAAQARVVAASPSLQLGRIIDLQVDNLHAWTQAGGAAWKLVPFVDQRAITGLYPIAVDTRSGRLQYLLDSGPDNAVVWEHLLSPLAFERPVRLSVGLEHQDPLPSAFDQGGQRVRLVVVDRWWCLLATALVAALGCAFVRLAIRTPLLMDAVSSADGTVRVRYSLAKVQFALWFFVVLSAFLVIWLTTGNFNSLDSSVVAVLGISAGTAVGDNLLMRMDGASAPGRPHPETGWRLWRAFLDDLVCDAQGHSITRFQMLAWTLVIVVVFIADVLDDLTMPVLGPELLYLLGLSSGTYVAHRRPDAGPAAPLATPTPTTATATATVRAPATPAPGTAPHG